MDIIIAGVLVPWQASHQLSQTYAPVGGRALLRYIDGSAILQTSWGRLSTTIAGEGRMPAGLDGVDWTSSFDIHCLAPRSLHSAGTGITLPSARRTDWPPAGYALVNGMLVRTDMVIVGDAATLTAVTGAQGYVAMYWPILTCYAAAPPAVEFNGRGTSYGWSLTAEEV